jgi:hypothetical protein
MTPIVPRATSTYGWKLASYAPAVLTGYKKLIVHRVPSYDVQSNDKDNVCNLVE